MEDDLQSFKMEDDLQNFKMEDDLRKFKMEDDLKNFQMEDDDEGNLHPRQPNKTKKQINLKWLWHRSG